MKITRLDSMLMLAIVAAASSVGCTTASPTIQTGPDAAVSFDGLHEIDNSRADIAWAVPDIDLSGYTSILPVSLGIEYTEVANKANTAVTRTQRGPYFIDDKARAEFEALVSEIFMEELQKSDRFRIVDERGPNTLIVAGGLLDVTSQVPPTRVGSSSRIYLSSVGDATLVLEIRDSETNRILARSIDRRAAEPIGSSFQTSNSVTDTAEIRRLIRYWATGLREALDGFTR
jgi:hypothetical protein